MDVREKIRELYVRNPRTKDIVRAIHKVSEEVSRKLGTVKIMDFCGTHEWTITHYGIRSLMPPSVELVAGPGCPVCITPGHYVDHLIRLSFEGIRVYTYGDSYMLPGRSGSRPRNLAEARAEGGMVTVVYSFLDAVKAALKERSKEHVFFAVGFETTMPAVADPLVRRAIPPNLKVLNAHRFT
ncbi:MAG: hydrogenase formation protein HypD, partial [Desulfurococcales archaeon]|nr:hydrogenase formation protein HypD [Desulfurococcales archaeon]